MVEKLNVLVTGGAGYVGSVLVPLLLERGFKVRVLDNLTYGPNGLIPHFINPNFEFVKGSILDEKTVKDCLRGMDVVVHLAAIVGYPACKKDPETARKVNLEGTKILAKNLSKGQKIIYSSTDSVYGNKQGIICTEETPPEPISVYGETKAQAEKYLLDNCSNVVIYRFATAFGLSPRLRLDLLINDFVFQALKKKILVVYEKDFKRAFVHIRDMARAIIFAIDNFDKMNKNIYCIGSEELNLTKEQVALAIRKKLDFYLHFADAGKDEDLRNYEFSFEKMRKTGFKTEVGLERGLDELIKGLREIEIKNPYTNA